MEQIVVKNELKGLDDYSKGTMSINYDKEMPSTSGIAIKQEVKEELYDRDNSMDYNVLRVKEESETFTDKEDDFDGAKQADLKFESEVLLNKGSKINNSNKESDNSNDGDESEEFSCNIKEEGRYSDFSEEDKNSSHNEEKDEDKAMFETKIEVEHDESRSDSEVVNKEIQAKNVLPNAENEMGKNTEPTNDEVGNSFNCGYECKHCSIEFFNKELCINHEIKCSKPRVRVDKEKVFQCDVCPKKYQTKKDLFGHKKYLHRKDELEKLKCGKCDYVTVQKGCFNRHLKIHDKKTYLKCHFCQYTAARLVHLNAHVLSKHKLENEEKNKIKITSKIHQCTKCTYSTLNKSHYNNHLKVCLKLENVNWYDCKICHFRTIHKRNLNTHIKTHNKIKELKCLFCEHQTNRKQDLDNHILFKHTDLLNESNQNLITSKVHCCQHCNYKTTLIVNFKSHLKNH